ncbi:cupredoxin domain-containing protein [Spirochaeta africana]|uniref:Plastocyanin n=1 Tax=Spirochaeta africana (strain ATCC 700263 / DSM 8902 / Z-7692) TaxID=889378 RepID=H9UIP6_SPIAZ|nr:cupredoxin domain-containing protein [Spirochaeta africana]AFG37389.1 plastocyanin [Spirochaeta africana DSM 8902]
MNTLQKRSTGYAVLGFVVAALMLAIPLSAQGQQESGHAGHGDQQAAAGNSEVEVFTPDADGVVEIEFSNRGFQYTPAAVQVPKGATVRIVYTSSGRHDWRLDGYGVGTAVLGNNQTETVEFTADTAGEFEFYCSVANHRAQGMAGRFIVAE